MQNSKTTQVVQILGQVHLLPRRFRKFKVEAEEVETKNCCKKTIYKICLV
jgi:hypothetical protein